MKKTFAGKLIVLGLAACALCAFAPIKANAQAYGYGSLTISAATTAGAATSTLTGSPIMDVTKIQNVTLFTKFGFSSSNLSNIVYTISQSYDKTNWNTISPIVWTVTAAAGTGVQRASTNINVGGIGYLKLETIQNTHASAVLTNSAFVYTIKRGAP